MFEESELNKIDQLQIEKNELRAYIRSINPASIVKPYIQAKSVYNKAIKTSNLKLAVKKQFSSELNKLAELLNLDENYILQLKNVDLLEIVKEKYADYDIDNEKIKYKKLSIKLETAKAKFKSLTTLETSKRRLNSDATNVLEYYTKKIPQVNVLDSQIKILEDEAINYQVKGLKDNYNKTLEVIKELKARRKDISNKFKNKTQINPDQYKAKKELINNDPQLKELRNRKRDIKKEIADNSPTKIAKKYLFAKENLDKIIVDFDDNTTVKIEQDYYDVLNQIVEITGESKEHITSLSNNKLKTLLSEYLDDRDLKVELNNINLEINDVRNEIMGITTTEDILMEIFDYENDETDGKIPKEVLVANNLKNTQNIVTSVCYSLGVMHYYDDALSGGLMGLTVAVNTWYEKQKNYKSAIKFKEFSAVHVANYARRAIEQMRNAMGKSGSSSATDRHKEKVRRNNINKLVDQYLVENPNMVDLKTELISELLFVEELNNPKISNRHKSNVTSETDYNSVLSGSDGNNADMWSMSTYDKDDYTADAMVDAKVTYNSILNSIDGLMNLFDVKQIKGTEQYQINENRKLMDVYDRKIFLMMTGMEHKRTKNELGDTSSTTLKNEKYTLEDIAEEIVQMKRNNGEVNATMAITSITARWKNIIKKLKVAIEMKPQLKKGLEYMLNYIENNRGLMEKLSNDREELSIKRDRDMLKNNYKDNENVMNIQMVDSSRLGDDYDLAVSNELQEFENLKL